MDRTSDEFPPAPEPGDATRRSFLKAAGFAFVAGCSRGIEHHAIPLLVKQEETTPGRALWYASLCGGCAAGCGILVKGRDGRPIKIEGNPEHPLNRGALCAVGQAMVLSLYDSHRLAQPLAAGQPSTWEAVDAEIVRRLATVRNVRVLTGTVNGPTRRAAIARFLARFPDGRHIAYDSLSCSALLDAHRQCFGRRALPRFRFDRARVIVSIDADFLATWISPVEFTRDWSLAREATTPRLVHHHYESRLSLTGSKADRRFRIAPDGTRATIERLLRGEGETARRLREASRGTTLVVCGSHDPGDQRLVARLNHELGNYGATLDLGRPSQQRAGDDAALAELRREIAAGEVGALLIAGANPQYDLADPLALDKVPLVLSFAALEDETAAQAHFVCPDHHPLESWDDAEPVEGLVTSGQPLLQPLHRTRALVESLARWSGSDATAREIVEETWRRDLGAGDRARAQAVHDGYFERALPSPGPLPFRPVEAGPAPVAATGFALLFHAKQGVLDGAHAHNPWLQEMPDPITKIAWDNYASLSPQAATDLGVAEGDLVRIESEGRGFTLPAHVQPGQHDGAVAVAIGYGRKGTDRFAGIGPSWIEGEPTVRKGETVGVNVAPLRPEGSDRRFGVSVTKARGRKDLACTQLWQSLTMPESVQPGERDMVRVVAPGEGVKTGGHGGAGIWAKDHTYEGHHWAMAIDLAKCTGCSACVIGCQAENNIPVVGRDEMRRQRSMHWLRIDRYHEGGDDDLTVAHQPMLCHHCDNAPCESVCPVLATVHSSEGLNQQVYNRCVGTRYCANNCPYKVRRFNWFDYPREDRLQNMVLNPDVVVRMRGVMEKCSFCVQRIHEAKAEAKRLGRPLADGEVRPACAQSCPSQAIVFGDRNDKASRIAAQRADGRHYHLLDELGIEPSVGYLALVRERGARDA